MSGEMQKADAAQLTRIASSHKLILHIRFIDESLDRLIPEQ